MTFPPVELGEIGRGWVGQSERKGSDGLLQCLSERDHDEPDWSSAATAEGKTARAGRNGAAQRGVSGPGKSRKSGSKR